MGVWGTGLFSNDDAAELLQLLLEGRATPRLVIDRINDAKADGHLARNACAALIAARYDHRLRPILTPDATRWLDSLQPDEFDPSHTTVETAFVHLEVLLVDQEWLESWRTPEKARAWCENAQKVKDSLEHTLAEWSATNGA